MFLLLFFTDGNDDVKEPKRPRLAPGANILEQLMTPMLDNNENEKQEGPLEVVDKDGDTTIIHIPDPRQESKVINLKLTFQGKKKCFHIYFYIVV